MADRYAIEKANWRGTLPSDNEESDYALEDDYNEELVKLTVKECIFIIQKQIVRNGNTPENERSRKHLDSIAERFGITFPIDYYPKE